MSDGSVDLIVTDPPYFKVKKEAWDRQWETPKAFLSWLDTVLVQFERILKPNGSLYMFASPRMAARVEVLIGERFNVLNSITWVKDAGWHKKCNKESLRQWYPVSERIIFAEHQSTLSQILSDARARHGLTMKQLTEIAGAYGVVNHGGAVSNWESGANVPTIEHWANMQEVINLPLYNDTVRPFSVSADVPYTDVWTFPTVQAYKGKHPCEKPLILMDHIIKTSSRKGSVVFDPFMGSGTTGIAAISNECSFIGCDIDSKWVDRSRNRIESLQGLKQLELV